MGLVKFLLKTFIFLWVLLSIILWFALSYVLKGESSPIKDDAIYSEILSDPEKFTVNIEKVPCVNEGQKCLVVSGIKGKKPTTYSANHELKKRKINVPPYGQSYSFLVMLHDKGGRKEELLTKALPYVASGFTVILADLPGHGDNTSEFTWASSENDAEFIPSIIYDVKQATRHQHKTAYLWSESVGSAYAHRTVVKYPDMFEAMIVVSSYDNLESLFESHIDYIPGFLRAPIIAEAKFFAGFKGVDIEQSTPDKWAQNIQIPVIVMHGKKDELIPVSLGESLFKNYKSENKKIRIFPNRDHKNIFIKRNKVNRLVFADTIEFLLK